MRRVPLRAASSRARLDFPMPPAPITVTSRAVRRRAHSSRTSRNRASSRWRPTKGVVVPAGTGAPVRRPVSRQAAISSRRPFTASGPSDSAVAAERTSRHVRGPSRTSPAAAAASSRAATFTASPSTGPTAFPSSAARTRPVFTPTRIASSTPQALRSSPFSDRTPSPSSAAARTARRASSSRTTAAPKTPTTASPMYLSTAPPWRRIVAETTS